MGSPLLWVGNAAKLLKSILDINGNAQLHSGAVDPTSSAVDAPMGSLYLNSSTGLIYRKTDNGSSTNWAPFSQGVDESDEITNLALDVAVSANALTVSLKTKSGSDPSSGDPIKLAFRDSTITSGTYVQRSVTAATSFTLSSGSTLGHVSGRNQYIYVYAIDNAGTVELAVSASRIFDEGSVHSTTAEGGAGGADSATTLYSATARTDVAVRYIGRLLSNQATAGTWASNMSEVSLAQRGTDKNEISELAFDTGNGHGSTNNKIRIYTTKRIDRGSGDWSHNFSGNIGTNGLEITILKNGLYSIAMSDTASAGHAIGVSKNSASLTTSVHSLFADVMIRGGAEANITSHCAVTAHLRAGDVIRPHTDGNPNDTVGRAIFHITKLRDE